MPEPFPEEPAGHDGDLSVGEPPAQRSGGSGAAAFPLGQLPGLLPVAAWPPAEPLASRFHAFRAGPVQVYALTLPADPEPWLAALEPLASAARRQRAARFYFRADALRCLAAEALLRQALLASHGLELGGLELRTGPNGKPSLADHPGVQFNLSHSGAWLLCALHDRAVGIDVEEMHLRPALPAEAVMALAEFRHYGSLAPPAARDFFFRLWTLKESLLKALGTGLTLDPRDFCLDFQDNGVTATQGELGLGGWNLLELAMPDGVKASLCFDDAVAGGRRSLVL